MIKNILELKCDRCGLVKSEEYDGTGVALALLEQSQLVRMGYNHLSILGKGTLLCPKCSSLHSNLKAMHHKELDKFLKDELLYREIK